jgi:pyruvate formate lyase activating enzyme
MNATAPEPSAARTEPAPQPRQAPLTGTVFNVMRYSTHDGPGIRTTVFLKGCPLSCWWCHNPESWNHVPGEVYLAERCTGCGTCIADCPAGALSPTPPGMQADPLLCRHCGRCVEVCPAGARERTGWVAGVPDLVKTVERDIPFYDQSGGGVTFSGGEPLGQPQFLMALLTECGRLEIHRAVDTSGCADPRALARVARLTDLFLYDLKAVDPARHRAATGVDNARILENLKLLSGSGARVIVRIPVIPGVNDDDESMAAAGRFVAGLPRRHPVELLPYHRTAAAKYRRLGLGFCGENVAPPSAGRMAGLAACLSGFGLETSVGG